MKVLESPIIDLPLPRIAICLGLLFVVALVLRRWRSPVERDIYVATLRMVIQLSLAAFLLTFLLNLNQAGWVLAALVVMWLIASLVALRPLREGKRELFPLSALSLAAGSGVTLWVVTAWVIGHEPWYNPRYFLPIAGMILANGMTGISLAAERAASEMEHRKEAMREGLKAGRSSWEVALPALERAYHAALLPTINSMLVVGIVAFPGMMTGQILSGTAPWIAIKYQIVVMCMILSSIGISTPLYLKLAYRRYLPHERPLT